MRPALQRLLGRPSSLELVRSLIGRPLEFSPRAVKVSFRPPQPCRRHNSSDSAATEGTTSGSFLDVRVDGWEPPPPIQIPRKPSDWTTSRPRYSAFEYGPWKESLWTREEIEFQSNLEEKGPRLINQPNHREDLQLWACLFEYRQRTHGVAGVRMFWNAAVRGDFQVPVGGEYAELFWDQFVKLGLQDEDMLNEILEYSNRTLESTNERWPELYIKIVQNMLLSDRGEEAIAWHNRLFELHPPPPDTFTEMACQVIFRQGDTRAFKTIYETTSYRNLYGTVVPFLCEREDFDSAYRWHFNFLRSGDLPITSKKSEPLVHYLAVYERPRAIKVINTLVEAGVPFASSIAQMSTDHAVLTREMMNLMHGETFNMHAKDYNDNIGARWFATRWISLDIAMTAISALGVKEIGPLSLQAIALREQDSEGITHRLNQLRDLSISIGNSVFSKSVEKFARSKNQASLDLLLQSDQHPDAFEDGKLQEQLLTSYARSEDWPRYNLTMDMRLIGSKDPELESNNILLRRHATTGDTSTLLASLQKMHMEGETVTVNTLKTILQNVLEHRERGHRPQQTMKGDDLMMVIDILRRSIQSGSFVPATYWREIIRRLGMVGRWKDLEELCVFLASWYGPASRDVVLTSETRGRVHQYQLPVQVKTIHPLHPLKILFPTSLQRAIVEWGFMHALRPRVNSPKGLVHRARSLPSVTCGIHLLRQLHGYHVHIDINTVRRAIFDRLVIYYGPGESNKVYNRRARENNELSLEEMAVQIDEALGMHMFDRPELRHLIETHGNDRINKAEKKKYAQRRPPQRRY